MKRSCKTARETRAASARRRLNTSCSGSSHAHSFGHPAGWRWRGCDGGRRLDCQVNAGAKHPHKSRHESQHADIGSDHADQGDKSYCGSAPSDPDRHRIPSQADDCSGAREHNPDNVCVKRNEPALRSVSSTASSVVRPWPSLKPMAKNAVLSTKLAPTAVRAPPRHTNESQPGSPSARLNVDQSLAAKTTKKTAPKVSIVAPTKTFSPEPLA